MGYDQHVNRLEGALLGRRYVLPAPVSAALQQIFEESVGEVLVIEHSRYARAHLGMSATTRPHRILLAASGAQFIADPELLLHEYFHVLRQWSTGYLTRRRYLYESARRGYWENRFEREAREFSAAALERYHGYLNEARGWPTMHRVANPPRDKALDSRRMSLVFFH